MQPKEEKWEDSTAAAIAACGLLELTKQCMCEEREMYYQAAMNLLRTLAEQRADWSEDTDAILEHCAVSYHKGVDINHMMYADYFFIEAIWKLTGEETFIW